MQSRTSKAASDSVSGRASPICPFPNTKRVQLAPSINWSRISKKSQVSDVSWLGKAVSQVNAFPASLDSSLVHPRPPLSVRAWVRSVSGFEMLSEWWRLAQEPLSSLTLRGLTMPLLWVELSLNIFYCRGQTTRRFGVRGWF